MPNFEIEVNRTLVSRCRVTLYMVSTKYLVNVGKLCEGVYIKQAEQTALRAVFSLIRGLRPLIIPRHGPSAHNWVKYI